MIIVNMVYYYIMYFVLERGEGEEVKGQIPGNSPRTNSREMIPDGPTRTPPRGEKNSSRE